MASNVENVSIWWRHHAQNRDHMTGYPEDSSSSDGSQSIDTPHKVDNWFYESLMDWGTSNKHIWRRSPHCVCSFYAHTHTRVYEGNIVLVHCKFKGATEHPFNTFKLHYHLNTCERMLPCWMLHVLKYVMDQLFWFIRYFASIDISRNLDENVVEIAIYHTKKPSWMTDIFGQRIPIPLWKLFG